MAGFEAVFGVPANHTLKQTGFHSHSGGQAESWDHEEFDQLGALVACYQSWANTDYYGNSKDAGWTKSDTGGQVIAAGSDLPI